jgi:predicted GIY-YIG superfamily endonuclease
MSWSRPQAARLISQRVGGAACKTDTRYFILMQKKDRKPKARPSGEKWFVYILRCGDGSLYTGITKDVKRRCQQHNAGTASRYTRSRRPVKLVYHEARPDQSSALKREAAIKAMNRRGKMTMIQQRKKQAKGGREIAHLEDIPNVGPSIAADLRQLGITTPAELPGRDPYAMYEDLCRITGQRHDPCLLDTFIAAVRYMEGAPKKPWWKYTAERKRVMARRSGDS